MWINPSEIVEKTAADGVITGFGRINSHLFNKEGCKVAIIINDFTVLAGTQGFFHHKKIDRIIKKATLENIPIIIFTEGGGGRPGDTDVKINNSWLDFDTFEPLLYWLVALSYLHNSETIVSMMEKFQLLQWALTHRFYI